MMWTTPIYSLLLLFFTFVQVAAENHAPQPPNILDVIIPRHQIKDTDCLECHGVEGYAVPSGAHGDEKKRRLDLNAEALRESVHGKLTCLQCHQDIQQLPHDKKGLQAVDCVTCHLSLKEGTIPERRTWLIDQEPDIVTKTKQYTTSIHAKEHKGTPTKVNAGCADCHTAHYVFLSQDHRATTYRLNSPEMCGHCHEKALNEYRQSVHGMALRTPWKGESATCSDCHSAHEATHKKALNASRVFTQQCRQCHAQATKTYMFTTHGQLAWLGNTQVARCQNCHLSHTMKAVDDSSSPTHEKNLLETCRKCHKKAGPEFTQFRAHHDISDYEQSPQLWWVGRIMVGLVIGVLLFFYTHSMLWFYREIKSRPVNWVKIASRAYLVRERRVKHHSGQHIQRFSWPWRLNHWVLALSVMTLVFTGMGVMFSGTPWTVQVVKWIGGTENLRLLHRIAGIAFFAAVIGHALALIYVIFYQKKGQFDWFGPNSLLPRKQDITDMIAQFRWFFGKGEAPRFDHWTYWEKFDYWAVYWGAFVIGLSGVLLWFSEHFNQILPGWIFNVATLAHGLEAFLAVTTLFVVHFFNNHFRPSKFPLDTVMFTGSWDVEEFKEERPMEYERLVSIGALQSKLVPPPSKGVNILSHLLGFSLIGIGIALLILVILGFLEKGLV